MGALYKDCEVFRKMTVAMSLVTQYRRDGGIPALDTYGHQIPADKPNNATMPCPRPSILRIYEFATGGMSYPLLRSLR